MPEPPTPYVAPDAFHVPRPPVAPVDRDLLQQCRHDPRWAASKIEELRLIVELLMLRKAHEFKPPAADAPVSEV